MKLYFEEGDELYIFGKKLRIEIVNKDKLICSCECEYPIEVTKTEDGLLISPWWNIKLRNLRTGTKVKSKAHGEIIFDGAYNGFIFCHISNSDNTQVVFNKRGQLCWWNKEERTWCYDDESEIILDMWGEPKLFVNYYNVVQ